MYERFWEDDETWMGEFETDPREQIDLAAIEVPDNEYTRAYRAECEKLFSDPGLRLAGQPDWRPAVMEDRDGTV